VPAEPHAPSDASLPVRIGGYRVVRRLATGGTSDVLLARAEGLHGFERAVVLKLLLQQYRGDEQFERMFAREAAAYARLSHPAIVKLYDFFSDTGQLVMVLEYVEGLPLHKLRALLRKPRFLNDPAAMFVGARIFGALAAAHSAHDPQTQELAPVIHRDVNPSNVLIPWDGHVKIADFGIAKITGVDNDKTQAGFIKGTYGYMAPEQVRGESVTVRTDVYVASLLLWELLVGRKAIVRGSGSDLDVLRAMAEPTFPTLASLRPDLPPDVLMAIARGLERDPQRRDISSDEIATALRGACDLEQGRQRLVDTLAAIRPPSIHDDASAPLARTPYVVVPVPPDSSADATVPNKLALAATMVAPPRRSQLDTIPEVPRAPPPKPVTQKIPSVAMPPRPLAQNARAHKATLMGISVSSPALPAAAAPPLATTLLIQPAPQPPPTPPPLPPAPPVVVMASPVPPPRAPVPPPLPPPPPPPMAAAMPMTPPPAPMATTMPLTPPPGFVPPTPAPAPVAWTPPPNPLQSAYAPSVPPPPPRGPGRIVALVVIVGAVIGVAAVLLLWAHGRSPSAYVPPPKPSATSSGTQPTPAPSAVATATATPTPDSTTGTITVPESRAGHRVYVDKRVIGESPGTFTVRCGWQAVKVGSQGNVQNVNVPCGGDVEVK
jgi:serine/threonine-protein kinase